MTMDWTPEHLARLEEVNNVYAARLVRHILDTAVVPRVGYMLAGTLDGRPVPGCHHLMGSPLDKTPTTRAGVLDWMCEGEGLCRGCALEHLSDPATPHRDPQQEVCIVCGHRDDHSLHALPARVKLRKALPVTSDSLVMLGDQMGQKIAMGYVGELLTTPIAWECPAHELPRLHNHAHVAAARKRQRPHKAAQEIEGKKDNRRRRSPPRRNAVVPRQ
jgi:hypothetical protein